MLSARQGWRTSTYSSNGTNCVEVNPSASGISIRHSKNPTGPVITFTPEQWSQWLTELTSGSTSTSNGAVVVTLLTDGCWQVAAVALDTSLNFTAGEVAAFLLGVRDGEFNFALAPVA
jgi:hypothetical protein